VEGGWGGKLVRLSERFKDKEVIRELVVKIGRYKKRSRGYRSRRFKLSHSDDVEDAINLVLHDISRKRKD